MSPAWVKLLGLVQERRRLPRKDRVLDDYFTQLLADYDHIPTERLTEAAQAFAAEAKKLYGQDRLTWAMAFAFERVILMMLSGSEVAARAWHMRDRYRGIVTKDQYALYEKTHQQDSDVEVLRNDLASLLLVLTEYYTLRQGIEEERTEFSHRVQLMTGLLLGTLGLLHPAMRNLWRQFHGFYVVAALLIGSVLGVMGWWYGRRSWKNSGVAILVFAGAGWLVASTDKLPAPVSSISTISAPSFVTTLLMVVIAGLFGGAFSMLQRVQSPIIDGDPLSNLLSLRTARREILLAPIIGAVGAIVLYCAFDAKLLEGAFFPVMYGVPKPPKGGSLMFTDYLWGSGPVDGIAQAKLLVWSFIAGFSERLLPDTLDRITKHASSNNATSK